MKRFHTTRVVMGAMLALFAVGVAPVAGQTGSDEMSEGGGRCRRHLLGDAGHKLLHGRAWDLSLVYTAELFSNLHGGQNTRAATEYLGNFSALLSVDTEEAGWWPGGQFYVHLDNQHGEGLTNDHVGDFAFLSNIDRGRSLTQINEAWYRHQFNEHYWASAGKLEGNCEFGAIENAFGFINSSASYPVTIPMVTAPDTNWGVVGGGVWERASVNLGLYDSRPQGGPMVMIEPRWHYQAGDRPGALRVGAWWNGNDLAALAAARTYDSSYGFYLTWDQTLWAPDEARQLGLFGFYGWAPSDRSVASQAYGLGLACRPWTGRPDDECGLGWFQTRFSRDAGLAQNNETVLEAFYGATVTEWLTAKADFQLIHNPGGADVGDAVVVGTRVETVF